MATTTQRRTIRRTTTTRTPMLQGTFPAWLTLAGWGAAAVLSVGSVGAVVTMQAAHEAQEAQPRVIVCFDREGAPLSHFAAWADVRECRPVAIREVR